MYLRDGGFDAMAAETSIWSTPDPKVCTAAAVAAQGEARRRGWSEAKLGEPEEISTRGPGTTARCSTWVRVHEAGKA